MAKKILIEFNGKIACLSEHCRDLKVKITTVQSRHYKTGEPYEKCLEYYQKNGVKKKGIAKKLTEDYTVKDFNLYTKWYNAKDRCENPKNPMYYRYGKRGIKVCDRWQVYENFENDMLESFLEHVKQFGLHDTQIERNNYDGNYEPSNVTWATSKEQGNNRSSNRMITEDLNVMQFAEKYNINYETVRQRLNAGWSLEKIINTSTEKAKYYLPCNNGTKLLLEHCKQNKYSYNTVVSYITQYKLQPHEALAKWLKMKHNINIAQIAKELGVSRQAIHQRLQKGQSWDKILNDLS